MDEQKDELLLNQEAPTMDELPVYDVVTEATTYPEKAQTAIESLIETARNFPNLSLFSESIGRAEFEEFKSKVIAAFKHSGYDVRKHFGV